MLSYVGIDNDRANYGYAISVPMGWHTSCRGNLLAQFLQEEMAGMILADELLAWFLQGGG
jgi:hypothetical protein